MKRFSRWIAPPLFLALLTVLLAPGQEVYAKKRSRAAAKKGKSAAKVAKVTKSSAKSKRGERVARGKSARSRERQAREPKVSRGEVQALLRQQRRGRLSRAERQKLVAYHAAMRRRAEAIRLARLRAIRARDEALRNSAAANILKDNTTGEDPDVRRAAIEALGGKSGTVVVMDPMSGRVYSIVNQRMALGSPVKPCSTIKTYVGLAAMREQVFDPNLDVHFAGGHLNLTDALARSNNPFFQVLGRRLGFDRVLQYAQHYGLGEKTGVNHPGESDGFLPEEGEVEEGHMSSHGDGFGVTAMQLSAFTAAIANGGNLYVPRVPRTAEDAANFQPELKRKINLSAEDRLRLLAGMSGAVNFGTAKLAYDSVGQVAGKTGTCTGDTRDKLGLFTSFSSAENPKLVVTVITTGSTEAGKRAAEIAGRVYRAVSYRFLKEPQALPASASVEVGGESKSKLMPQQ
jgi:penicillin-binding protein 2